MLALSSAAGHSGRSLTTTYETITYLLHCSSSRRWLDDVMRQQEGIDDDIQHDVQFNCGDHEEGYSREERDDHEEGGNDHQKNLDQKEERDRGLSVAGSIGRGVTVARWLEPRGAAVSC
jgi:hypothetical protein